ncbi:hypothetical protein [Pseudomonas rhizosphaerae]|uniref:hypothetical protein n=1 Tax=Pseudomonas rhizosphaerae TaxID=216142 RepID=UPI00177AB4FD|nr:hypothetical protein [Pseudomonas rhizosphaerae]MBD8613149.1 hypothetical protein [Pseudomonas putida]MEB2871549.1 hypothetical protein [Pseudomonas rhizosphaerae]
MIEPNASTLFMGWDVGGWNCDRNPASRDALVVLDAERRLVGKPWRGNLRRTINEASSTEQFVHGLFKLCGVDSAANQAPRLLMGIDTPLGFSKPFIDLITRGVTVPTVGESSTNPYLHRRTEHFLFERGLYPLSPIKDMIGSQATKGMHVLGRFAPVREACGVWTDGQMLRAIEAYPSACKRSASIEALRAPFYLNGASMPGLEHIDAQDALTCALVAWAFEHRPHLLARPTADIDPVEGWIFVPEDGLRAVGPLD